MATNMAEVLKFDARPIPYDNDERTWLEFRFKLENHLTLVNEQYVALLQDAESQPVANVPAGTDEPSVLIRTLSHTLHALLATLTTGRRLETGTASTEPKRVRSLGTVGGGKRTEDCGSKIRNVAMLCCSREWVTVRQNSRKPGMRGNTRWTSRRNWRRQKLDDGCENQCGSARGTDQTPRQLAGTLNSSRATTASCEQSSKRT